MSTLTTIEIVSRQIGIEDRERDYLVELWVEQQPELPQQVVKNRPCVIANVPDYDTKFGRNGENFIYCKLIHPLITFRFSVADEPIRTLAAPVLDRLLKLMKMIICLVEFKERPI